MELNKIFTGHRYWCILSIYAGILPWWVDLKQFFTGFKSAHVLIGSKTWYKTCARLHFGLYLCYDMEFLYNFFTEDSPYQYLQDATSIVLWSDKSAEKLKEKNLKWYALVLQARESRLWSHNYLPKSQYFQANF